MLKILEGRSEQVVIPAKAGIAFQQRGALVIHFFGKPLKKLGPGFRRDDD
ncbi:MAG: hypothetical protein KA124_01930 [Luteimonas sp.]|nr:hypothetical protein [Luteimonas sp.]